MGRTVLPTLLLLLVLAKVRGFPTESFMTDFDPSESFPLDYQSQSIAATLKGNKTYGPSLTSPDLKQLLFTTHVNYAAGFGSRPLVQRDCRCGIRNPAGFARILNGEPAKVNEFPWRVSINPAENPVLSLCAGALIHKDWVLTSASCLYHKTLEGILVDLGDHNLHDSKEAVNVLVGVKQKIIHQDYVFPRSTNQNARYPNNGLEENDIALLKLSEPIEEENIMPVCLPRSFHQSEDFNGLKMITSGWGVIGPEGTSRVLNRVALTYISNELCKREILPRYFPGLRAPTSDKHVYTFDINKGIYPVDHGTTLEYVDASDGLYYALGVADAVQVNEVSNGVKQMLGAWTDITKYLDWIHQHTENAQFCQPT